MQVNKFIQLLGLWLLAAWPLNADPVASVHTTVELISDSREIAPGQTFQLGVRFDMEPEWHIYWKNPGASGLPPELDWQLPDGFEAGEIQWPTPERISLEGLVSYGFKDVVTLIVPVKAPVDLEPGREVAIGLDLSFLICKEVCLPGDASVDLTLVAGEAQVPSADTAHFERARASQPQAAAPFTFEAVAQNETTLTVAISGDDLPGELYFFAEEAGRVDPNPEQSYSIEDGVGRLSLPLDFAFFENKATEIPGVLRSSETSWRAVLPVERETTEAAAADGDPAQTTAPTTTGAGGLERKLLDLGLVGWLLLAFVGGLILNVMPCVLPVLSLKVFSLLNHSGQSRAHAFAHGIAYTVGVVASFVLLAGVLFGLRALGESIGWGFQLQNPGFVLALGLVFFLFGLNLLGVFEIGSGLVGADAKVANRKDLLGSFGVGVLAAVVGAPCVGPFVGGVSGVALQTNTFTGLLIFAMLGFGMASPFLFLAIFPKLVGYLPKPGPWMETFKQSMGFLLLGALVFLLYLLGQLAGVIAISAMLVVLLVAGIAAWIYGRWGAPGKSGRGPRIAKLVALALLLIGGFWGLRAVDAAYDSYSGGGAVDSNWAAWSPEAVDRAVEAGKPVFVDFTATWCLICQVNKKTALRTEATRELFEKHDVVSLVADWTRRDPEITAELEKFGRSGVPLYLLYGPDGEVAVLPQNLTNGTIRDAVEKLQ
jgi:thiol:disulfide interchange protein DsbD